MSGLSIADYFAFARVKVVGQAVHNTGAILYAEPDRRWHPLCHNCRRPASTIHSQGHRRTVRDLNLVDRQVWLQVEYRKIWCPACGRARVEYLSFCNAHQRLTHRLRRYIYELCKMLSVAEVARHLDLDHKTVTTVEREFLQAEFGQTDYEGLRVLAIDEIAVKKGQQYMTVILDYDSGRVVWAGQGHDKQTLDGFFAGMTDAQKAAIQAVAIDMHDPYINRLEHHCPQALIVFDLFHVVKAFGRVVDEVRREEVRKAVGADQQVIKGSRYLLLKNRDNLRADQQDRLDELLRINQRLNAVYVLKDQLKVIYHYGNRAGAQAALEAWCTMASKIDNWWMQQFIKMLRRYAYGIVNHCVFPIGTSRLEGVNNRIKLIKRKAYGFHDTEHFALKIKQAFPGETKETINFSG
jgi:transposase